MGPDFGRLNLMPCADIISRHPKLRKVAGEAQVAEVFISYKSERRPAAEHMAAVLERYGYSVWFDHQLIKGQDFGMQIDRKVRAAKALVVLWCSRSVTSRWVAEEVDLAHTLGILVPLKIEPCELPVGFRRQDYINLVEWDGAPRSHQLDPLLDALEQKVGRAPHLNFMAMRDYEAAWRRFGAPTLSKFGLDQRSQEHEGDRGLPGSTSRPSSETAPVALNRAAAASGPLHDNTFWERQWEKHGLSDNLTALSDIADEAPRLFANQARVRIAELEAAQQRRAEEQAAAEQRTADFRAQGRIKVDARIFHGDSNGARYGWFKPGAGKSEWFKDLDISSEMVVVPAGTFMMGSTDYDNEMPLHSVTISKPFAVGRHAVTFDEWDACVADGGCNGCKPEDKGWGRGRRPVINVSLEDAKAYISWLSRMTGKTYRLLSEAECEYVTRAGTETLFWWGSSISTSQANYDARTSLSDYRARRANTGGRPYPSTVSNPIRGDSTRCMATSGSGVRTIGTKTTKERPWTALSGQAAIHSTAFCAAVPGSTFQRFSARPTATGPLPITATSSSAFVLAERSDLFSPDLLTS